MMASSSSKGWVEVSAAENNKRKELNLHGAEVNSRIEKDGLDDNIYSLVDLNSLKITGTPLKILSSDLGNLKLLISLNLENNKLEELPETVGNLSNLKTIDISGNKLQSLPASFSELTNLQSLNANLNALSSFPNVSQMKSLAYVSLSRNQLSALPEGICDSSLTLLSTIEAAYNQIQVIPPEISQLSHLIKLDVSFNKLDALPLELCECPKLKEVMISENKMKDRKCLKLADHSTKALLAHLKSLLEKERAAAEKEGKSKSKSKLKGKKKGGKGDEHEELVKDMINTLKFTEDGLTLSVTPAVLTVRPYIVCCIIRNLNFAKSNNMFKRFINIQTKLHDSICDKRQSATIATHDLKTTKGPLVYDAASPSSIEITPLFKTKPKTAAEFMLDLRNEAEAFRREKKRHTISGIHKYLCHMDNMTVYPYLRDSEGDCISLPPLTNSEKTKISSETTDILVEVTGHKSLDTCKTVMEEFLKETLATGVGTPVVSAELQDTSETSAEGSAVTSGAASEAVGGADKKVQQSLTVEQVKIEDHEGRLRVVYPARDDLLNPAFDVIRN